MKTKLNWTKTLFIIGVIAVIIGVIDPLEGSVIIVIGAALISFAAFSSKDYYRKVFLSSFVMMFVGVFALFYLSSLGGFGGSSTLSWWWGIFILPYPIGWLITIITLVVRRTKREGKHVVS